MNTEVERSAALRRPEEETVLARRPKKSGHPLLKMVGIALAAFAVIHSMPDLIRELKLYRM